MKEKSIFRQVMLIVFVGLGCVLLTAAAALFFGTFKAELFDLSSLNFSNMIPVLIIGGFLTLVVIVISVIFVSRSVFYKIKEYINKK